MLYPYIKSCGFKTKAANIVAACQIITEKYNGEVPADMDAGDVPAAIEEICEKLRRGKCPDAQSARDEILHTVACKAAIKAGWDTHPKELEAVVDAVISGQVRYCPHGRPVSVTLTRKELDNQFKRIV